MVGACVLAVLLSSCATQRFDINAPVGPSGEPALDTSQAFFVGGIGQDVMADATEVCGSAENVASVETEISFLDGLLTSLTGSICSPRTARVYCS